MKNNGKIQGTSSTNGGFSTSMPVYRQENDEVTINVRTGSYFIYVHTTDFADEVAVNWVFSLQCHYSSLFGRGHSHLTCIEWHRSNRLRDWFVGTYYVE